MQIKTFRARTLRDALAKVRAELGADAAVLHSREVNTGPIARLFRGKAVEVAATPDHSPLAEQAERAGVVAAASRPVNRVAPRLADLGELVNGLATREAFRAEQSFQNDSDSEGHKATSADPHRPRSIGERLATTGPIRLEAGGRRVVALVGPTGVGKTTTLAKLAANFRLREKARVGVVTVDTYRVAAVEQLRTYAEIIDLPMEVVATPAEMRAAIDRMADLDLVLIDTAGRSPRDQTQIEELRRLLAEAAPDETHLVLSTTATADSLGEAIERFGVVRPTALLLTKLDEAPTLDHTVAPVIASSLAVSYLTDGQNVPEDIRTARPDSLAAGPLHAEAA